MKPTNFTKFPRKYNPFLTYKDLPVSKITGSSQDGLHKYEVDFLETAEWTTKALNLVNSFNLDVKQDSKIPLNSSLCFQTVQEHIYDYTIPQPLNNSVILLVKVNNLPVSENIKHVLKLICGKYYNSRTDLIKINSKDTIDCPPQETCTAQDNIDHLKSMFSKILSSASRNEFKDLKFHTRNSKNLEFPKEWLELK